MLTQYTRKPSFGMLPGLDHIFIFYILFEVLACFFLGWFGEYGEERSFVADTCLVDTCCGYW